MGGRLTDSQGMNRASIILLVGFVLSLLLIAFALRQPFAMIGLVALLGAATYGAIPPLQSRILMLAERHQPQAMDVASGMNIAAFNAGVVVGSGTGGAAINTWGLPSLAPVGAAVTVVAVGALLWQIAFIDEGVAARSYTGARAERALTLPAAGQGFHRRVRFGCATNARSSRRLGGRR